MRTGAFGMWILRPDDDRSAGGHETEAGRGVELLYAIASARWREGLATEAGREAVEITRGLGLDELVCFTLVDNIASRRTMEGLGFTGALPVRHAGLPHVLTRLVLRQREVSERG